MSEGDDPQCAIAIGFRRDVSVIDRGHALAFQNARVESVVRPVSDAMRDAFQSLIETVDGELELANRILGEDGAAGLSVWYFHVRQLKNANLIRYVVTDRGGELLAAAPMVRGRDFAPQQVDDSAAYRLSRFAYARAQNDVTVLETPLSDVEIVLAGHAAGALFVALARPMTLAELTQLVPLGEAALRGCFSLMLAAGVLAAVTDGQVEEDRLPSLRQWEFHDLLFHVRSRLGRHDHGAGGTFRFLGDLPPRPAAREAYPGTPIPLARPPAEPAGTLSLQEALTARRSVRRHGSKPISLRRLGWFLFHAARVDAVIPADASRSRHYETSRRPYPSGGATYDLELYLTVGACAGLAPGLYHYDGVEHALRLVRTGCAATDSLLEGARVAAKMESRPQVLLTLASRFQRLSWKYETIAYAASLKNVGVLYHHMYLVATALSLAPCALGSGDSEAFSRAVGSDFYAEGSVGEFMLGSR